MKLSRRTLLLLLMLTTFVGSTAVAYSAGTARNPWRNKEVNDVLVKQAAVVEILTWQEEGNKKNFKFSITRPFEIYPERWCVIVSSDVHSEYVGNMPYQQCFDVNERSPTRLKEFVKNLGISQRYMIENMGKEPGK